MKRRFPSIRTSIGLLICCTFLGIFLFSAYRINDNDIFRHLKVGEYILATASIPDQDPFACTTGQKPFLLDSWLPSVVFHLVFSCCGFAGLVLFKAAMVTFTFFLLWVTVRKDIRYPHVVMWVFLFAALVARGRFEVRPQILTMGFLALEYYLLESALRYGKGKYLLGIIPLLGVWANVHSGWSYGVVLLGLTVLAEGVGYAKILLREGKYAGGSQTIFLYLVYAFFLSLVLSLVTVQVVNPSGFRVLLLPLMIKEESFFRNIREFMPAYRYINPYFFGFALLLVGSFIISYRSVALRELFVSAFFLILAVRYSRASYPFVVLVCPMMVRNVHGYIDRITCRKMASEGDQNRFTRLGVGAAFVLLIVVVALVITNGRGYQPGFGLNRKKEVLFRMSSLIGEKRLGGNIFTCSPSEGDFFIWARWPENRVFVDGRGAMVYEENFYIEHFLKVVNQKPGWEELLDYHNVRIIIASLKMCVRLFLELERNSQWEMIFQEKGYRMYVRTSPSGEPDMFTERVCQ